MASYITTHNSSGEAVFSPKITTPRPHIYFDLSQPDSGSLRLLYDSDTTQSISPRKIDIDTYVDRWALSRRWYYRASGEAPSPRTLSNNIDTLPTTRRTTGYPPKSISPPDGFSMGIVTMGPGAVSPMHRTMTLDTILVLDDVLELHLDSEEMKTLKAGDSIVQRGTIHMWKKITPDGGKVKMVAVAQPIVAPIEVGGKKLESE